MNKEEEEKRRSEIFDSLTTEFGIWIHKPGNIDRVIGKRNFTSDHHSGVTDHAGDDNGAPELRNWVNISVNDGEGHAPIERRRREKKCLSK